MKKVEAIIEPDKLAAVKDALTNIGIEIITVSEVHGQHGRHGGEVVYRGHKYNVDLLPRLRFDVVVPDESVDRAVNAIANVAQVGDMGDESIFVYNLAETVRIRNGVRDAVAGQGNLTSAAGRDHIRDNAMAPARRGNRSVTRL